MNHRILPIILCSSLIYAPAIYPAVRILAKKQDAKNFDLLIAIDRGDLEGVKMAICQGADVNEKLGLNHDPALHFALNCLKNDAYKQQHIHELRSSAIKALGSMAVLGGCAYAVSYGWQQMLTKQQPTDTISQQLANTLRNANNGGLLSMSKYVLYSLFGGVVIAGIAERSIHVGLPHLTHVLKMPSHYWNLLARLCIIDEILAQKNLERESILGALDIVQVWELDKENSKELMKNVHRALEKALKNQEAGAAKPSA